MVVAMPDILATARATRNRGRTHLFLGHPLADACDKTCIEPGGASSPGVWTCGIRLWVDGVTPDDLPWPAIGFAFAPPVATSTWSAGTTTVTHRTTQVSGEGAHGVDYHAITLSAPAEVGIVVTEVGPAGGTLHGLAWDDATRTLTINRDLRLIVEGAFPISVSFESDAAALELRGDQLAFRVQHGFADRPFGAELAALPQPSRPSSVADGFAVATAAWRDAVPARIFAPDARIAAAWQACAWHLQAAMECGHPRIGAVDYPVFWLRDGVLCLHALDLLGRHDLARLGAEALAPQIFGGGFGAEADAPGQGLWALVSHAQLSGDSAWLAGRYSAVRERALWIERMLDASGPLRALSENRMPRYQHSPGISVVCLAARQGTIHGRMDWHCPDFFINCWSQCGLRLAAEVAAAQGDAASATHWASRAADLDAALAAHLLPQFGNDRDPAITPWPSGALAGHHDQLRQHFSAWYRTHRLHADGTRRAEPHWTYFEAAQAHNALLLGLREEAWTTLDGLLDVPAQIHGEGSPAGNETLPFRNDAAARGWLDPAVATHGNLPHNWTSAEMIAALRDLFVVERDGRLVLGLGVPRSWLVPGARFGVERLPTTFGPISYTAVVNPDRSIALTVDSRAPCIPAFPSFTAFSTP